MCFVICEWLDRCDWNCVRFYLTVCARTLKHHAPALTLSHAHRYIRHMCMPLHAHTRSCTQGRKRFIQPGGHNPHSQCFSPISDTFPTKWGLKGQVSLWPEVAEESRWREDAEEGLLGSGARSPSPLPPCLPSSVSSLT